MTDSSFSSASLRIQRGRNPSSSHSAAARNSTHYDDGSLRLPSGGGGGAPGGGGAGGHSLRSVSSRFSLSEHFAATRSLYEFGFDDASSYAAPSVMVPDMAALHEGGDKEMGDLMEEEEEKERRDVEALLEGDFYDVLCLPRGMALTKEEARRAYHRMFLLFYPETYPEPMQAIARRQFERAQEGFEVLVDEVKRRAYDRRRVGEVDEAEDDDGEWKRMGPRSDVGVRVDASKGIRGYRPLDFEVGHSSFMAVPSLTPNLSPFGLTTTTPALTLSSSIYGIIPPMSALPMHLISSPHQPLQPATSPRHRLLQLVENKLSPVIGARLTHEIVNHRNTPNNTKWLGTRAEYGLDILPNLAPSFRLFHHLRLLPDVETPTLIETSIRGRSWWSSSEEDHGTPPRAALAIHHPFSFGTAFARVDSGNWAFTPESYRFLASAADAEARELRYADFPLQVAPMIELGFTTTRTKELQATSWQDGPQATVLSIQDQKPEPNVGSWTASAAVCPLDNLTTSIRYTSPPVPLLSASHVELDLSTSTLNPSNLSLRHLIPITTSTHIGLELSLSRFSTHVSLHVSRLNQRFSLPLFLPPVEHLKPQTLFVASAVPFVALAVYKFISSRTSKREKKRHERKDEEEEEVLDTASPIVQIAIARRREEADHLTGLLAHPVATRQKHHASHGNLVILSAKFGLSSSSNTNSPSAPNITLNSNHPVSNLAFHPDEEIADVTVALAALVNDQTGGLWIPAGVRKGCIPGFWDPAPGREKLLLVRYSWRGKEDLIAVRGLEELVLPPR